MMEIEINDSEILDLISEFLYSRKLFRTADALEQETAKNYSLQHLPKDLYFIREFVKKGQWDTVLQCIQAFKDVDEFPTKTALCLLFCQMFCEVSTGGNMEESSYKFKDIMEEIQSSCSCQEFMEMKKYFLAYVNNQAQSYQNVEDLITGTRYDFFYQMQEILTPILRPHNPTKERLVTLLAKGLLYDQCTSQCCQIATNDLQPIKEDSNKICFSKLKSDSLSGSNVIGGLYNWIQNLNDPAIFAKHFEETNVTIIGKRLETSYSNNCFGPEINNTFRVPETNENETVITDSQSSKNIQQMVEENVSENKQTHEKEEEDLINEQLVGRMEREKLLKQVSERLKDGKRIQEELSAYLPNNEAENIKVQSPEKNEAQNYQTEKKQENQNIHSEQLSEKMSKSPQTSFSESYFPVEKTPDQAAIRAVAFNPKGDVYVVGSNSRALKLCKVPKEAFHLNRPKENLGKRSIGQPHFLSKLNNIHSGSIYALAWNDEGNLLASCSNDKSIKSLRLNDNHSYFCDKTNEILLDHHGIIRDIVFVHGYSSVLASGGSVDHFVYTSDCEMGTTLHKLEGHSDQVLSLSTWRNGMIASASQDKSVRIWDIRSDRCVSVLGFGQPITTGVQPSIPTSINVDPTGQYLAVGRDDSVISIYDFKAGKSILDYKTHSDEVRSVRFNPTQSNLLLSGSYDNNACVTNINALISQPDLVEKHSLKCEYHSDKVIQCRWHPKGLSFASTSADTNCVLWALEAK